jgi:hypothetical protein
MSDDDKIDRDFGQVLGADLGGATDWARFAGLALMADIHRAKAANAKLEAARLAFKHGGSAAAPGVLARAAERERQAEIMVGEARELHRQLTADLEKRFEGLDVKALQADDDARGVVLARTLFERLRTIRDADKKDDGKKKDRDDAVDPEDEKKRREEEGDQASRVVVSGRTVDPNRAGVRDIRVDALSADNNRLGSAVSAADGAYAISIALDAELQRKLAPNGMLVLELAASTRDGTAVGRGKAQVRIGGEVAVDILVRPGPQGPPVQPVRPIRPVRPPR